MALERLSFSLNVIQNQFYYEIVGHERHGVEQQIYFKGPHAGPEAESH